MIEGELPIEPLPVARLLDVEGLALEILAGKAGLERRIANQRIQKPGIALAGFTAHVHPDRLQVLGLTEIDFLNQSAPEARVSGIEALIVGASPE